MKKTTAGKELQRKINHFISEFVKSITKDSSKKIRKSLKKASKIIAKAVSKKVDESEVEISLQKKTPVTKAPVANRKRTAKKRATASVKRSNTKVAQKTNPVIPVKTAAKTDATPKTPPEIKSLKSETY